MTSTVRRFSSVALPYSLLILGIVALLAALVALMAPSLPSVTNEKPIKVTGAQFDPPPYGTSETPPTEVLSAGFVAPQGGEVLAATGADNIVPWAAFAAALLAVGTSVLVIESRRRRTRSNPST